jgi:hypothetical protein
MGLPEHVDCAAAMLASAQQVQQHQPGEATRLKSNSPSQPGQSSRRAAAATNMAVAMVDLKLYRPRL